MADISDNQVLVGGQILIRMDDKIIGFANEATCSDSYGMQPITILGQLQSIAHVPTDARHVIQLNVMVLRNASLIRNNLEPQGAGNYGLYSGTDSIGGLGRSQDPSPTDLKDVTTQAQLEDALSTSLSTTTDTKSTGRAGLLRVLHGKRFDIDILTADPFSTATKKRVVRYKKCYFDSGNVRFSSNAITVHSCTFFALDRQGMLIASADS